MTGEGGTGMTGEGATRMTRKEHCHYRVNQCPYDVIPVLDTGIPKKG
ncbi:MAG: hypothetical protein ACEY3H_00980 [Wolbachia sp.]